jgi:hypothetical protein
VREYVARENLKTRPASVWPEVAILKGETEFGAKSIKLHIDQSTKKILVIILFLKNVVLAMSRTLMR